MAREDAEPPSLTIRTMTDYLTARSAHQRFSIMQNRKSQLGVRRFAPYYQPARAAIRRYHSGDEEALRKEIEALLRARLDALRPTEMAKIENNLRVLTDYDEHFSEEDVEHRNRRFAPLIVEGVRISTEPTLSGTIREGRVRTPCNIVVDPQAEAPDEVEIDYVLELLFRGSGLTHRTPPRGARYWHASSGETWTLARSSPRRWRDIEDAAREIVLRWPTVGILTAARAASSR
ncbi:MAG TPA: hypothetical protein VE591_12055 [Candidatus Acidoferrum sp.]|nr:hypothetical protein [Candidatus Acidoferrum sp.]